MELLQKEKLEEGNDAKGHHDGKMSSNSCSDSWL